MGVHLTVPPLVFSVHIWGVLYHDSVGASSE